MKKKNIFMDFHNEKKVGGINCHPLRLQRKQYRRNQMLQLSFLSIFVVSTIATIIVAIKRTHDNRSLTEQQVALEQEKDNIKEVFKQPTVVITPVLADTDWTKGRSVNAPDILPEYQTLYEQNNDIIGWLKIKDTVIDYPVMQTPKDEDYYLDCDFYKKDNINGCLIMDTDSVVGGGTKLYRYADDTKPSTNLIIHGHNMKSGMMFGNLKLYAEKDYGTAHSRIEFDSLYEKREYQLIAVFYSQVYMNTDKVFKYYQFFEADTKDEFANWYDNIKEMSLYDTGVRAEHGDEFLTLSCCSYQVTDGRFVVVAKRIK